MFPASVHRKNTLDNFHVGDLFALCYTSTCYFGILNLDALLFPSEKYLFERTFALTKVVKKDESGEAFPKANILVFMRKRTSEADWNLIKMSFHGRCEQSPEA